MIGEAMLIGAIVGAVLFLVVLAYVTIEESIRGKQSRRIQPGSRIK